MRFSETRKTRAGKVFVTTRPTTISYIIRRIKNRYISSATPRQSAADCEEQARVGEDNKQSEKQSDSKCKKYNPTKQQPPPQVTRPAIELETRKA